jgi:hypothetical protein
MMIQIDEHTRDLVLKSHISDNEVTVAQEHTKAEAIKAVTALANTASQHPALLDLFTHMAEKLTKTLG